MSTTSQRRPPQERDALDRFFKGLPVEEAKSALLIVANGGDAKKAKKGDPANCGLAQACKRLFNSTAVVFFRSRAYVDVPNDKGERVVKRFLITPAARAAIVEFDQSGAFPPGGFTLRPPAPSQRLEAQRAAGKKHRQAIVKGERKAEPNGIALKRGDALALQGVRSGAGMVHFRADN